jgi:hypothetical protein
LRRTVTPRYSRPPSRTGVGPSPPPGRRRPTLTQSAIPSSVAQCNLLGLPIAKRSSVTEPRVLWNTRGPGGDRVPPTSGRAAAGRERQRETRGRMACGRSLPRCHTSQSGFGRSAGSRRTSYYRADCWREQSCFRTVPGTDLLQSSPRNARADLGVSCRRLLDTPPCRPATMSGQRDHRGLHQSFMFPKTSSIHGRPTRIRPCFRRRPITDTSQVHDVGEMSAARRFGRTGDTCWKHGTITPRLTRLRGPMHT